MQDINLRGEFIKAGVIQDNIICHCKTLFPTGLDL